MPDDYGNVSDDPKVVAKRYYDPSTKHYYKADTLVSRDDLSLNNKNNVQIWYPENKLSFKTIKDPLTNKNYNIEKIYDEEGNYTYKYTELKIKYVKKPGTSYYRATYI